MLDVGAHVCLLIFTFLSSHSYTCTHSVHQPHHAVHCPDCNVCIAHYDHHCPWMGTCIGGSNMKPFVRFNLSWFLLLLYVMAFVAFADPPINRSSAASASSHDGAWNATRNGNFSTPTQEKNITHVVFGHGTP
jgi:hypothetical protein